MGGREKEGDPQEGRAHPPRNKNPNWMAAASERGLPASRLGGLRGAPMYNILIIRANIAKNVVNDLADRVETNCGIIFLERCT